MDTVALFPTHESGHWSSCTTAKGRGPASGRLDDDRLVYGVELPSERPARDRRRAKLSVMSSAHTDTPTRHHSLHGLRIINVAMRCNNQWLITRSGRCPVEMQFKWPFPSASLIAVCMYHASLAFWDVLLFITIIFSSVINAHKYFCKSHSRKSYELPYCAYHVQIKFTQFYAITPEIEENDA